MNNAPLISVIVPCRNEENFIEPCLQDILNFERPDGGIEVLVLDGLSDDGTREKVRKFAEIHQEFRFLDNPRLITPSALNIGIEKARGEVIIRLDVHTRYAPNYLKACIKVLKATNADNVGGPWVAGNGETFIAKAIGASFSAPFAIGGASSHNPSYEGPVDSVYLGCWPRGAFERYGMFDEEFIRNQDDEHNLRIIRGGGRIWQSPEIKSCYSPRRSLYGLFRQYYQYGYWKVKILRKHKIPASYRHLVPAAFVSFTIALLMMGVLWRRSFFLLGLEMAAYIGLDVLCGLSAAIKNRDWSLAFILPFVFPIYHIGYGTGFISGVLDFLVLRRSPSKHSTTITRENSETKS
jgi:succinoglycan biosynthesis protein ExoA